MNRRTLLASGLAWPIATAHGATTWNHRMLYGGFDGTVHHAGLALTLAKNWKTYWRNPGDGGVPPTIDMQGDNVAAIAFDCPLPQRFSDASGNAIGYKDEVVFPIRVTPRDAAKPTSGKLMAFFGVCEVVCIPVPLELPMMFSAEVEPGPDTTELQRWQLRVPQLRADGPVVQLESVNGNLRATLRQHVDDILVEFRDSPQRIVAAPEITGEGAMLQVAGKPTDLKGLRVRTTAVTRGIGVEQELRIV